MKHCPWHKSIKCVFRRILWIGRKPTVSVVVPVYKVEPYLPACLDSILAQSYERLEVICVDDGSPDNSIDVLRAYAAKDGRIKIVRQGNSGPGPARNTGIAKSTGDMLFFVDSDDTIPPKAVEHLLTSLMRSGSDFALGSLMRDTPSGRHIPLWARKLHATTRIRLSLADEPDALKNVFPWTKMFHRKFFLSVVERFPDGIYEDQVPAAKAYINGTFDIIKDIVCYYRIRDDSSSITQQKASLSDLTARWKAIQDVSDCMTQEPIHVQRVWQTKALGFDMRLYYEQVPRTGPDFWEFLQDRVRCFVDSAGYNILRSVPVADRLTAAATYHGYRDDVKELLWRRESQTWKVPGVVVDGIPRVTDEFFQGLRLRPDGVVETLEAPDDITLAQHVDSARIEGDDLVLRGSAYLTNLSQSFQNSKLTLFARPTRAGSSTRNITPIRVTRYLNLATELRARDPWNDHTASGFDAFFPLPQMEKGDWDLSIVLEVSGVKRSAPLTLPDASTAGRLPSFGPLTDKGRWYVVVNHSRGALQVRRTIASQLAVNRLVAGPGGLCVELDGSVPATEGQFEAIASDKARTVGIASSSDRRTLVRFSIPTISRSKNNWTLWWRRGRRRTKLAWACSSRSVSTRAARPFLVSSSPAGNIVVQTGPLLGEVDAVSMHAYGLLVSGWLERDMSLVGDITARLWNEMTPGRSISLGVANGRFTVTLPLTSTSGGALSCTLGYSLVLETPACERFWPRVSDELLAAMPITNSYGGLQARFTVTPLARALRVRLAATQADRQSFDRRQA